MPNWYKYLLVSLFSAFIFLLPQIILPRPNLIDITETWSVGKNVIQSTLTDFTNPERFRPLYMLHRSLMNLLFDYHPQLYFLSAAVMLGITLYIILAILNLSGSGSGFIPLLIFVFLVSPVTVDVYWRLGAAENLQTLILILSIYSGLKKKYKLLTVSLILLMLTKETGIFYIPVFLIYLLYREQIFSAAVITIVYILINLRLLTLVYYISLHPRIYTALLSFTPEKVFQMFIYYLYSWLSYILIFSISVFICIYRCYHRNKPDFHGFVNSLLLCGICITGFISLLFFQNKNQPYYFFPSLAVAVLFFFHELARLPGKSARTVVFLVILLLFAFRIPESAFIRMKFWQQDYIGDGMLIDEIINQSAKRKYIFAKPERPEYAPALEFLNNRLNMDSANRQIYYISHADHIAEKTGVTWLCGKSIIDGSYCKWEVVPADRYSNNHKI